MRTKASQLQQQVLDNLSEFLRTVNAHMELIGGDKPYILIQLHLNSGWGGDCVASVGPIMQLHNDSQDIANTASTSHCMLLEKSLKAGKLNAGDSALLISFGSGLAMLAMYFHMPEGQ